MRADGLLRGTHAHSRALPERGCRPNLVAVRILFIGDIVGEPGRRACRERIPVLRESLGIDYVVANGENAAGGSGITPSTAAEIFAAGVDVITSGDHLWDQREVSQLLVSEPRFLRPANYAPEVPGRGATVVSRPGCAPLGVLNLQGRTFMAPLENPFVVGPRELASLKAQAAVVIVDFHAEATSEKIALGWHLDGQVSLVVGTHTHVQTADERILPGGTACLTDAGFTGGHDGVLGREYAPILKRFLTQTPQRFEVCTRGIQLNGCWVDVDESTGRARSIHRVSERLGVS